MSNIQEKLKAFYIGLENGDELRIRILEYLALIQDTLRDKIDPKSGDYMPVPISSFIAKLKTQSQIEINISHERVYRMLSYLRKPLEVILATPRNKINRFHQLMPQYQARNFDRQSIQWLIRRPGKDLAEKIALSPQLLAVKRNFVLDTSENRLLKEFLRRLYELLQLRQKCLTQKLSSFENRIGNDIASWLREEGSGIGKWNNVPPNNILLNDKYYRKVWDAWCTLRKLEAYLEYDLNNVSYYSLQIFLFELINCLSERGVRFAEFPLKIDYATTITGRGFDLLFYPTEINGISICERGDYPVSINLLGSKLLIKVNKSIVNCNFISFNEIEIDGNCFTCDTILFNSALTAIVNKLDEKKLLPRKELVRKVKTIKTDSITIDFAYSNIQYCKAKNARNTDIFLARQYWDVLETSVALSNVPAWQFCDEARIFSIANLLWNNLDECKNINLVAKELAKDAKDYIHSEDITFVIPDIMDDFGDNAKYFKQAFENAFRDSNITWIPTSIAVVFALHDVWNIHPQKYKCYCIVEHFYDKLTITPVLLKKPSYSQKMLQLCPETQGYIWERQQPFVQRITLDEICAIERVCDRISTPVFEHGNWYSPSQYNAKTIVKVNNAIIKEVLQNINADEIEIVLASPNLVFDEFHPIGLVRSYSELLQRDGLRIISRGGEALREMQRKYPDHPLWTDNLPPISLIFLGGQELKLISDDHDPIMTTGKQEILLTTSQCKMKLQRGTKIQEFDVKRQKGNICFRYKAQISLLELLKNDTNCVVKLYYTYGVAEPYRLIFEPEKGAMDIFKPVQAQLIPIAEALLEDKDNYYSAPAIASPYHPWDKNDSEQQKKMKLVIKEFNTSWWRELGVLLINPDEYIEKYQRTISFVGHANKQIKCVFSEHTQGTNREIFCSKSSFCDPLVFDTLTADKKLRAVISEDNVKHTLYGDCVFLINSQNNWLELELPTYINLYMGNERYMRMYAIKDKNIVITPKNRIDGNTNNSHILLCNKKLGLFSEIIVTGYLSDRQIGYAKIVSSFLTELEGQSCSFKLSDLIDSNYPKNAQHFYALITRNRNTGRLYANVLCTSPIDIYEAFIYSKSMTFYDIEMQNYYDVGLTDNGEIINVYKDYFDNDFAFYNRMNSDYSCVIEPNGKTAYVVTQGDILERHRRKLINKKIRDVSINANKLFNFGYRSIDDSAPIDLQMYSSRTAKDLFEILKTRSNDNQDFAGLLAEWLSHYGKNIPNGFGDWLLEQVSDYYCPLFLAYCVGNIDFDWQQKLWKKMVSTLETFYDEDICLNIVEIVIQKFDRPVYMMSYVLAERVVAIANSRILVLEPEIGQKQTHDKLKKYLRIIWLLLRLRKHEDSDVKKILHPGRERTQHLAEIMLRLNNANAIIPLPYDKTKQLTDELYNYLTGLNPDTSIELVEEDEE